MREHIDARQCSVDGTLSREELVGPFLTPLNDNVFLKSQLANDRRQEKALADEGSYNGDEGDREDQVALWKWCAG